MRKKIKGSELRREIAWLRQELTNTRNRAAILIANTSKNHFVEGFRRGGFMTDDSVGGWKPRKYKSKRSQGRAILVKTGDLRRSILVKSRAPERIIIGTEGIRYAMVHNFGLETGRRKARFIMPKREFIGDSKTLERKLIEMLNNQLRKI